MSFWKSGSLRKGSQIGSSLKRAVRRLLIVKNERVVMRVSNSIAELRQQIHDDLRIQHPEWIEPNGECPECDFYEARLMEELDTLMRSGSDESHRRDSSAPLNRE
jgi:hypothetical protein